MKDGLEDYCQVKTYSRIDYCADYGKPECPNTCYYAQQVSEQMNRFVPFKNELNFDVRVAG